MPSAWDDGSRICHELRINCEEVHARTAIFGDKLNDEASSDSSDWGEEQEEEEEKVRNECW